HLMVLSSLHVSRSKNVVCSLPVQFFLSSRRRHTSPKRDWSSDVCSSDLDFSDSFYLENLCPFILSYNKTEKKYRFILFVIEKEMIFSTIIGSFLRIIIFAGNFPFM